jgi:hypothetical protein
MQQGTESSNTNPAARHWKITRLDLTTREVTTLATNCTEQLVVKYLTELVNKGELIVFVFDNVEHHISPIESQVEESKL